MELKEESDCFLFFFRPLLSHGRSFPFDWHFNNSRFNFRSQPSNRECECDWNGIWHGPPVYIVLFVEWPFHFLHLVCRIFAPGHLPKRRTVEFIAIDQADTCRPIMKFRMQFFGYASAIYSWNVYIMPWTDVTQIFAAAGSEIIYMLEESFGSIVSKITGFSVIGMQYNLDRVRPFNHIVSARTWDKFQFT